MKKNIAFFLVLISLSCLIPKNIVHGLTTGDYIYEVEDNGVVITECLCHPNKIPSEIDGHLVIAIGDSAFHPYYKDENLEIPDTVQIIGEKAFLGVLGRGFPDITIPESVETIGLYAVGYSEVYLPDQDAWYIERLDNVIIRGYTGTAAESYANENGFTFIALDDQTTTTEVSTATTITTTAAESQTQTFTTTTSSTLCGDINLDGTIDISDAVLLQKYAAEMVELNQQQRLNGDCNADGSTDAQDVLSLLRFLVRLTEVLPDVIAN